MQYVGQLLPLPRARMRPGMCTINSVLHAPPQTFSLSKANSLVPYGGLRFVGLKLSTHAARTRTDFSTFLGWEQLLVAAHDNHEIKASLSELFVPPFCPKH